jgi:gliding motility-associated-like protein
MNPTILQATGSATDLTCFGSNNGTIDVTASGSSGNFTYTWSSPNGATTQDLTGLDNGSYDLTITLSETINTTQCSSSQTLSFTIDEPAEIQINQSAIIEPLCAGGNGGSINITVLNAQGNASYAWTPNGATTEDVFNLTAGQYVVSIVDANSCNKTATFTIDEPTQLLASLSPANISCFGETDGKIDANGSGGIQNYSYLWNNNQTTQSLSNLDGGTYTVTITDNNGCTAVKSAVISVPEKLTVIAGTNDTIAVGYSANLTVDSLKGGTPEYTYTWYDIKDNSIVGTGTQLTVSPNQNTYYRLVVVDSTQKCEASDTIYIRVDVNLYDFPDGFAPNGGVAVNQTFGIIASPVVDLIEIKIFNRWGQLLFSGNGNGAKWDGTFNGELQPMDTYVYQAQVQLPDGSRENKAGNVILVW